MAQQFNLRNPAVKRLMKEAQELRDSTELFFAQPLEDNLFEWHFTIRGPADSEFDGGFYHGRIILPPEYPMKPPSIIILTPNGRFELHTKICLTISGHHPESWRPSWSIRTALLAIIGFMPTHGGGAIGSLNYSNDERKSFAKKSVDWKCPDCGLIRNLLKPLTEASKEQEKEAKELASQIDFKGEKKKGEGAKENEPTPDEAPAATAADDGANNAAGPTPPFLPPGAQLPPFQFPPGMAPPPFPPGMPGMPPPFLPGMFMPPPPMPFQMPPGNGGANVQNNPMQMPQMRPPFPNGPNTMPNVAQMPNMGQMPNMWMPPPFMPPFMPPGMMGFAPMPNQNFNVPTNNTDSNLRQRNVGQQSAPAAAQAQTPEAQQAQAQNGGQNIDWWSLFFVLMCTLGIAILMLKRLHSNDLLNW